MAQLAKTEFCKSGQLLPFEFPISYMVNPHWPGAFVTEDLNVPPLPVNPKAALFLCVSANKKHVETQAKISAIFHMYIDGICKAICCAWQDWAKQAVLQNVLINGATAAAGMVTGPRWKPVIAQKGPRETKMKKLYTQAIAKALGEAWSKYELSLKVPGLPWYPRFAASPPGPAAPTENVATPVVQLQQDISALQRAALKESMLKHLSERVSMAQVISVASTAATGGATGAATAAVSAVKGIISGSIRPHAAALMDSIAYAFEVCFKQWQTTSQVTKVLGSGVNPANVPAPVVGGIGNMLPGGFESATPDAAMMFDAIGPKEGFVSGLYDDKAPGPNMSKPARGLNWGGSHAIGYGTDVGRTFDPANLTRDQLFKRRLFNQLGYTNTQFEAFMRQELFLRDGEGERLFGLSITDPQEGYITVARGIFPQLGTYTLDQQIAIIDLCYNYGSGNLVKYGQSVISAIKSGNWTAAGDGVLNLPSHGTTFAQANPTRAGAISGGLKKPPDPDPCS